LQETKSVKLPENHVKMVMFSNFLVSTQYHMHHTYFTYTISNQTEPPEW